MTDPEWEVEIEWFDPFKSGFLDDRGNYCYGRGRCSFTFRASVLGVIKRPRGGDDPQDRKFFLQSEDGKVWPIPHESYKKWYFRKGGYSRIDFRQASKQAPLFGWEWISPEQKDREGADYETAPRPENIELMKRDEVKLKKGQTYKQALKLLSDG